MHFNSSQGQFLCKINLAGIHTQQYYYVLSVLSTDYPYNITRYHQQGCDGSEITIRGYIRYARHLSGPLILSITSPGFHKLARAPGAFQKTESQAGKHVVSLDGVKVEQSGHCFQGSRVPQSVPTPVVLPEGVMHDPPSYRTMLKFRVKWVYSVYCQISRRLEGNQGKLLF